MKRILLVEDDPAHTFLIRSALKEFNGRIIIDTVDSGEAALEQIKSEPPDLVILDLNMPGMNGFEFLEAKRHLEKPLRFIPAIVLTTSPLARDIWASYELGAAAYIVKPSEYADIKHVAGCLLGFFRKVQFANLNN